MPEIHVGIFKRLTDDMCEKIETVIVKLHTPPCPNTKVINESKLVIIDHFWNKFHLFQQQTGPFAKFKSRFIMPDAVNGNSFIWNQLYSLPYTKLLGFVACHTTLKQLRIGASERSWSDVKQIKDRKRSNWEVHH